MKEWFNSDKYRVHMDVIDSVESLLDEDTLDDISVSEICRRANISRATFYYHFKDKFDIVQWHYRFVAEHLLFETGRTLTWYQANYFNTHEVAKRKKLYYGAFHCRGYQSLFSYSKRRRKETLIETITEYKKLPLDEELVFQVNTFAEAEVSAISTWFKERMPYGIDTLAKYLDGIVPSRLYDLLNTPVWPQKLD